MKAVILAGGRGTRLAPYTTVFPKPLVPIGEHPIIELLIRRLIAEGITDIVLSVGYLAELIRAYFSQRPSLTSAIRLTYLSEERPSGTAGSLAGLKGETSTFLAMNGDILTNLSFRAIIDHHQKSGAALTIAAHRKSVKIDLGVLDVDGAGRVTGYREKPELACLVSMGVYVYEPAILEYIGENEYLDFPDLVLRLIGAGKRVAAYHSEDLWLDIGCHEDYQEAVRAFADKPELFGMFGLGPDVAGEKGNSQ